MNCVSRGFKGFIFKNLQVLYPFHVSRWIFVKSTKYRVNEISSSEWNFVESTKFRRVNKMSLCFFIEPSKFRRVNEISLRSWNFNEFFHQFFNEILLTRRNFGNLVKKTQGHFVDSTKFHSLDEISSWHMNRTIGYEIASEDSTENCLFSVVNQVLVELLPVRTTTVKTM